LIVQVTTAIGIAMNQTFATRNYYYPDEVGTG